MDDEISESFADSMADAEQAPNRTVIGRGLDEFFGDWSEAEARDFLDSVAIFEHLDASLWQ
ncbi:MAG: hypothetical protein AAF560_14030 [Acidobacteriota bacterium]